MSNNTTMIKTAFKAGFGAYLGFVTAQAVVTAFNESLKYLTERINENGDKEDEATEEK